MSSHDRISQAFAEMAKYKGLYDSWVNKLYDENGDFYHDLWNDETANRMESDIKGMKLLFSI
jgi:hypothetical protein